MLSAEINNAVSGREISIALDEIAPKAVLGLFESVGFPAGSE
jgi:hypothetical protein